MLSYTWRSLRAATVAGWRLAGTATINHRVVRIELDVTAGSVEMLLR